VEFLEKGATIEQDVLANLKAVLPEQVRLPVHVLPCYIRGMLPYMYLLASMLSMARVSCFTVPPMVLI